MVFVLDSDGACCPGTGQGHGRIGWYWPQGQNLGRDIGPMVAITRASTSTFSFVLVPLKEVCTARDPMGRRSPDRGHI